MTQDERRELSRRDYYDQQIDAIIQQARDKNALRRLSSLAQTELADAPEFSAETIEDLRAYCTNFCELVTALSELNFIERRMWNTESAQTLVQAMIDKIGNEEN